MFLARIVGRVVATVKQDTLAGQTLQWIQPVDAHGVSRGRPLVAVDTVGLGPGELCYYITAREASFTLENSFAAVDAGIVGKVDTINVADAAEGRAGERGMGNREQGRT
jgi:ethanolamine utilization protein EutN